MSQGRLRQKAETFVDFFLPETLRDPVADPVARLNARVQILSLSVLALAMVVAFSVYLIGGNHQKNLLVLPLAAG